MLNRSSQDARQCRRCKQGEPHVRFAPLSYRICIHCRAELRTQSALRLALIEDTTGALARSTPTRPRSGICAAHLAWIRSHPCTVRHPRCGSIIHAHHIRNRTGGGTGMKPGDEWAVPLCAGHHSELHTRGHATFEAHHAVDLRATAERLARLSPHLNQPASGADPCL